MSERFARLLLRLEWRHSFLSFSPGTISPCADPLPDPPPPHTIPPGRLLIRHKLWLWAVVSGNATMGFPCWDVTQLHGGGRKQSACLLTYSGSTLKEGLGSFSSCLFVCLFRSFYVSTPNPLPPPPRQSQLLVQNGTTPRQRRRAEVGALREENGGEQRGAEGSRGVQGAILVRTGLFWSSHAEAENPTAVWRPSSCNKAVLATGKALPCGLLHTVSCGGL